MSSRPTKRKWHCPEDEWYSRAELHWSAAKADVLGGIADEKLHDGTKGDPEHSRAFLARHVSSAAAGEDGCRPPLSALECGAGEGRVTEAVLLKLCERVHLVELSDALLQKARRRLSSYDGRVLYTQAHLRDFEPSQAYDVVWFQWCLGHLTDTSVVRLLTACRLAVQESEHKVGIFVKENVATPGECAGGPAWGRYALDEANMAVIRTARHQRNLFKAAGLRVSRCSRLAVSADLYGVVLYHLSVP